MSWGKRIFAGLLATAMIGLTACSGGITGSDYELTEALLGNVDIEKLSSNRFTQLDPEGTKPLPDYSLEGYSLVAENDALALYVNEKQASIRTVNKKTGYVWGALADENTDKLNRTWKAFGQSVVSLTYLNTEGAVSRIGAGHKDAKREYVYRENGFLLKVDFPKLDISLEASVTLDKDRLIFAVDDASIREEGNYYINMLYFAPFFGSVCEDETDGYMFIPDGSGALIRYQKSANYLKGYSARVYGLDHGIDTLTELNDLVSNRPTEFLKDSNTATLPVFGLTQGVNKEAVLGRITSGDCYAYINATPAGVSTDYNWVTASFVYHQTYSQPISKDGAGVSVVQKKANAVNPTVELHFLSGEDANYSGMARKYAQLLKADGTLVNNFPQNAPKLALDFVIADIQEGMLWNTTKKITSLAYMENAVEALHKQGIDHIALSLLGWQKGGLNGYDKTDIFKKTSLGSFDKLSKLKTLLQSGNGDLLLYIDPLRARENQINSRTEAGIGLNQSTVVKKAIDDTKFLGDIWYLKTPLAMNKLRAQMEVLSKAELNAAIDGAELLYGEYLVNEAVSRTEVKQLLCQLYAEMAQKNALTLYTPNQYLLKHTSVYRDAPVSNNQELYETDAVPFLQMVLSGNMAMIAPYANESFYSKIDLLKCIEYNVYPSYLLTEEANTELDKTTLADKNSTRFNDWQATITASYEFVNAVLGQVEGSQMLSHTRLNEAVYVIRYENGTVYVNYGSSDYNIGNGTTVSAENALFVPNV